MALQKNIDIGTNTGLIANYLRIMSKYEDINAGWLRATVALYTNSTQRHTPNIITEQEALFNDDATPKLDADGKQLYQTVTRQIPAKPVNGVYDEVVIGNSDYKPEMSIADIYVYLKTLPQYAGATDA